MADINRDLKEYLSRNDKRNGIPKSSSFSLPVNTDPTKWFAKSTDTQKVDDTGGWFSDAQQDPCLPTLTKNQRIIGFMGCILFGIFCFALASLYTPFLLLKARKFALLYSLGSLFIVSSFALLWGPWNHVKHLCSPARFPFTSVYFGSMFATLYFAIGIRSTGLTIMGAVIQVIALFWYIISYIPGGQTGLKFFRKVFTFTVKKGVQNTLPV